MNKSKFEKKLAAAKKSGILSLYSINKLFQEEKKSLFNNVKIETLIEDNFSSIMKLIGKGNESVLIEILYSHPSMRPFLERQDTIKYILDTVSHNDFGTIVFDSPINNKAQQFVYDNFDYILNNYPLKKIIDLYERMELKDDMKIKMDNYFNNAKSEFLSEVLTGILSIKGNVDKMQLNALIKIVSPLVDKVLEKEKCKITDTEILRGGGRSNVLRIGDTIIKIGIPRETFNIPNNKRFLQPYLRKDFSEEYGIPAAIEICDRVDTNLSLNEDKMYELYKELRDQGIVCGDFKYDNIGKLIKDNTPHNNYKNGMIGDIDEPLRAGEYVILDTDFIYNENDPNIILTSDMSRKFESRYQKQTIKKGR